MLTELRVENLLLIERAELCLDGALNVITGETGAGKTVLAHALDLLLGGRARPGIVRPGARDAYVEGTFDVPEALRRSLQDRLADGAAREALEDGDLVLARRVGADGRTRAYVGGRAAAVSDLRDLGTGLLAFYGQHEHRKLTVGAAQLEIIDGLCGEKHAARLRDCAAAHELVGALKERMSELAELAGLREREIDLLEHELAEIEQAAPDAREYEGLRAARERLRSIDALRSGAATAAAALAGEAEGGGSDRTGAVQQLAVAAAALGHLAGSDGALDVLGERARALAIESGELAADLQGYGEGSGLDDLDLDFERLGTSVSLDGVETRLAEIERLTRKHGGDVESVLRHASSARERRQELDGAEVELVAAGKRLEAALAARERHAAALRKTRRAAAKSFAPAVREQLSALAMGEASFEVEFSEREAGPAGGDGVDFVIAPNPGVPAGLLREIASGGELSRVMLAIMTVANAGAGETTLVFDEVDAGIGGQTARVVGAKLRELGNRRQVLCITHLPQIASLATRHFSIAKDTSADPTVTRVLELDGGDVESELVRMLGADSEDSGARRHARELLEAA